VAQWTGIAVTALIVLGCDLDVLTALPLGVVAGILTSSLAALAGQPARIKRK
jgi:hypothetical protein